MILQTLKEYYDRLDNDPKSDIPSYGYSQEKISWAIVIDREGNLVPPIQQLGNSDRNDKKKKSISKELFVPQSVKRTCNIKANFLWDKTGYALGVVSGGVTEPSLKTFDAFRDRLHEVGDSLDDQGIRAVLKFVDKWNPSEAINLENWNKIVGTNVVFKLDGERNFIHERPAVREAYAKYMDTNETINDGLCLVTGQDTRIAKLHPLIHGVRGAKKLGRNIVSFNLKSFCSYGKEQGYNAPVGEPAAFAYTTALNWLLRPSGDQKIQIADATTVFWAEKPSAMEKSFFYIFNPKPEIEENSLVDDRRTARKISFFLDAIRQGKWPYLEEDDNVKFYVLGLSPNSSRLSVRFWHVSTVKDIAEKIGKHFQDISIETQMSNDKQYPGMWQLLAETAVKNSKEKKLDNVSPLLGGAFMRSILTGGSYPRSLMSAIINRMRSEQDNPEKGIRKINYMRMSLLKGCLVRNHNKEVSMSLNNENTDPAYLLGRLFAVLESAQEDALGKNLNKTIKDRYFSSFSSTPRAVFPILLRLNQHHVAKGKSGGYYTFLIGKIIDQLPAAKLPTHMPLEDQGLFAIGYYHQRNDLFRKHDKTNEAETTN